MKANRLSGSWLTLLLLLVVLAPSVCLLWFMNRAVQNERLAVRQKLMDAYRGHLALAQERLENYWRQTASELETEAESLAAPALFSRQGRAGAADAVVVFDASGKALYPTSIPLPKREVLGAPWHEANSLELTDPAAAAKAFGDLALMSTNAELAARGLQGQARSLVQAGQLEAAISVLTGPLAEPRFERATDSQGTLLALNARLMALELLRDSAPLEAQAQFEQLKTRVDNYGDSAIPAPQRRFLMHEMQRLFPAQANFPTLAAEDLAARYLEADAGPLAKLSDSTNGWGWRATGVPGVWQFASNRGRVITLHQTESLAARLKSAVASPALPAEVRVDVLTPGAESEGLVLSLPLSPNLAGWRLALSLRNQGLFETKTEQRIAYYVWIGVLVVAVVAVLAVLALGLVRRQLALTQLRNDLVANVTHELKTPLSSMRLLVDTLLNSQRLEEPTAREYLQLIATENLRLSRLIDNFLTFSRVERNKYSFDFKVTAPATIVAGAAAAVRERFQALGCRFDVILPPELPTVVADADAMVTALVNLLDNACKYTGEDKQIGLTAAAQNGSLLLTVRDNGIGLAPREARRIFDRFYQVNQHPSRADGGCGLGLSIVRSIVAAHHGEVRVESELGKGSRFTVVLPVKAK